MVLSTTQRMRRAIIAILSCRLEPSTPLFHHFDLLFRPTPHPLGHGRERVRACRWAEGAKRQFGFTPEESAAHRSGEQRTVAAAGCQEFVAQIAQAQIVPRRAARKAKIAESHEGAPQAAGAQAPGEPAGPHAAGPGKARLHAGRRSGGAACPGHPPRTNGNEGFRPPRAGDQGDARPRAGPPTLFSFAGPNPPPRLSTRASSHEQSEAYWEAFPKRTISCCRPRTAATPGRSPAASRRSTRGRRGFFGPRPDPATPRTGSSRTSAKRR